MHTLIPIFIPLQEYGLLYSDIIGGIKYKINYFCDGRADEFIEEKLKEGKCVLIFDGVDDIAQEIDQKNSMQNLVILPHSIATIISLLQRVLTVIMENWAQKRSIFLLHRANKQFSKN